MGRPVEIRAYAERIELRQDGRVVGEHRRAFGRGKTIYDPWHTVPVLARKPGALRNGAPFKDWELRGALERVRRKLRGAPDGDRQMVEILVVRLQRLVPKRQPGPPAQLFVAVRLSETDPSAARDLSVSAEPRGAVLGDGLPAVEAACAEALTDGVHSADVILNILARRREPPPPDTIMTPEALRLAHAPAADCARYDSLSRADR